jgi:hypothetical protein
MEPPKKKMDPKILQNIQIIHSLENSSKRKESFGSILSIGLNSSKASKKFIVSECNSSAKNNSIRRKDKLNNLDIEYNRYLEIQHGIFILKCQILNKEW